MVEPDTCTDSEEQEQHCLQSVHCQALYSVHYAVGCKGQLALPLPSIVALHCCVHILTDWGRPPQLHSVTRVSERLL